jgi:hypothetical protein
MTRVSPFGTWHTQLYENPAPVRDCAIGIALAKHQVMSIARWAAWVVVGTMAACGGVVSATDAGPGGVCPTAPPTASSACSPDGLACEYGSNPDPSCNTAFMCMGGAWVDQTSGVACPPQSDCPATFASIPANQDCSPQGLACAYPEGECICTVSFEGVDKQTPSWGCIDAVSGCPSPRPDIGTPCTADSSNASCDYGSCSGGVALTCKEGVWQELITPCPV